MNADSPDVTRALETIGAPAMTYLSFAADVLPETTTETVSETAAAPEADPLPVRTASLPGPAPTLPPSLHTGAPPADVPVVTYPRPWPTPPAPPLPVFRADPAPAVASVAAWVPPRPVPLAPAFPTTTSMELVFRVLRGDGPEPHAPAAAPRGLHDVFQLL